MTIKRLTYTSRIVIFLILVSFVYGEDLYQYDSLELKLDVEGELELIAEEDGATVNSVKAELALCPRNSFRQTLLEWDSEGHLEDDKVVFEWSDKRFGKKEYGFEARIKTEDERMGIYKKISFPLLRVDSYGEYLEATETIDKDDSSIVEKATELAEGEDDLFKVVFKLAKWVEENIEYELNTLTVGVSQKASWVLEHKQGVCDEMTSLFIAMCRALGIPARFVSGVSYTTLELFEEDWLPHGWAEAYFPDYGWVSFDITFGEYGYVDVTHIKLREGFDPKETATKFEWKGYNVDLEMGDELKIFVEVEDKGESSEEGISLEEEILGEEVDFGSYNLIKGIVENKMDYYMATALRLAVPKEVEIIGKEKKIILLEPKEEKEIFWLVKVKEDLSEGYWYEFPIMIYSEKNVSAKGKFKAMEGGIFYSKEEAESLIPKEGEKSLVGKVIFDCDYEKKIKLNEEKEIICAVKNKGNVNLKRVNFCLEEACKKINLLINQEEELKVKVKGEEVGWQKLMVSVENEEIKKKMFLEYAVLDNPKIILEMEKPEVVDYGEEFTISLRVSKGSFSVPEKVTIALEGAGFENKWGMGELKNAQEFLVELNSKSLGKENKFKIKLLWEDSFGRKFEEEERVLVSVRGETFWEKMIMWFNGIIIFFIK